MIFYKKALDFFSRNLLNIYHECYNLIDYLLTIYYVIDSSEKLLDFYSVGFKMTPFPRVSNVL